MVCFGVVWTIGRFDWFRCWCLRLWWPQRPAHNHNWRWKGPSADGLQASRWGTSVVSWPRTSKCCWWRLASAWGWSAWLKNWWWGNSRWNWCSYARAIGCDTLTSWHGCCERRWTFRIKLFEGPSCWPYPLRFEHFRFKSEMLCKVVEPPTGIRAPNCPCSSCTCPTRVDQDSKCSETWNPAFICRAATALPYTPSLCSMVQ